MSYDDTIFALSSGRPPAAVAIVRVSGTHADAAMIALAGALPPARVGALRTLRDEDGTVLDRALVLWFPGSRTATGEPIAEFHLHGGRATVNAVLAALARISGLRGAEPGEFTRRALANGRIDLTQAEGMADLLAAETDSQRRAALATAEGAVARALEGWRQRIIDVAALVEAQLDFDDEDDVMVGDGEITRGIGSIAADMEAVLSAPLVERLHEGTIVALAGPPNSGKSSLFNALTERDAAIVTPIAGTTRDLIEASVVRNGNAYRFVDTAGLRETSDAVEAIGVARARGMLRTADLILWLGDTVPEAERHLHLNPRCDLPGRATQSGCLNVSIHRPATISRLWDRIEALTAIGAPRADQPWLNRRQHSASLDALLELRQSETTEDPLLTAEHLRRAVRLLDRARGVNDSEAVLDALFGRFCIGK